MTTANARCKPLHTEQSGTADRAMEAVIRLTERITGVSETLDGESSWPLFTLLQNIGISRRRTCMLSM